MKRLAFLPVVLLAAGVAALAIAPGSAADSQHFSFKLKPGVDAFWTTCPFAEPTGPSGPSGPSGPTGPGIPPGQVCTDTFVSAGVRTVKENGKPVKETCVFVDQFQYTFDENGRFVPISDTIGENCGRDVHFSIKSLKSASVQATVELQSCPVTFPSGPTGVTGPSGTTGGTTGPTGPSGPSGPSCTPTGQTATLNLTWTGFGPVFKYKDHTHVSGGGGTCFFKSSSAYREATVTDTLTGLAPVGTFEYGDIFSDSFTDIIHGEGCFF
jgi:hypothetical protein